MRLASLNEELESITRDYDYGIVPGSATIFVLDEIENLGRLDLTLLEGVMIVVEVNSQGYKITSHSPLYSGASALATTQAILAHINQPFETMENLLMTVSPMFCQRFQEVLYEKLQSVNQSQQQDGTGLSQQQQQQQQSSSPSYSNSNNNNSSSSTNASTILSSTSFDPHLSSTSSPSTNPSSLHNSTTGPNSTTDTRDNWIR